MNWGQKYKRVPQGTEGWLLAHLVGVDRKLDSLQPVVDFVEKLLLHERMADIYNHQNQALFDSASQNLLFQMFAIVAYLASNNILNISHMKTFLRWVSDMGFLGRLSRFVQMKSANMYAFRASLLRASISFRKNTTRKSSTRKSSTTSFLSIGAYVQVLLEGNYSTRLQALITQTQPAYWYLTVLISTSFGTIIFPVTV